MHIERNIPSDYPALRIVDSIADVFSAPADPAVNARLFPRTLSDEFDFEGLALHLLQSEWVAAHKIYPNETSILKNAAKHSDPGIARAAQRIIEDYKECRKARGFDPNKWQLRIQDEHYRPDSTVSHFHPDGVDRVMCCYFNLVTEWIRNEDAVDIGYGNASAFGDEIYSKKDDAPVYHFGNGDIWFQNKSFFHRVPALRPVKGVRLLSVFNL